VLSTHLHFPGYRPKATLPIYRGGTKFITAQTATFVLRKIHDAIKSDIINADGREYLGRYCWKLSYGAVLCLCVWMNLFTTRLEHNLPELLGNISLVVCREIWGRYGGAPAHFGRDSPEYLNKIFPRLWICHGGPTVWPAISPDLPPPDLFLWSHLTTVLQEMPIRKQGALLEKIITAFDSICQHTGVFELILQSIFRSCTLRIEAGCLHFEQLLSELERLRSGL
jgi:hypothetical protein